MNYITASQSFGTGFLIPQCSTKNTVYLSFALLQCRSHVGSSFLKIFLKQQKGADLESRLWEIPSATTAGNGPHATELLQSSHSSAWDPVGCLNSPENETIPAVNDYLPRLSLRASFLNGISKDPTIEWWKKSDVPKELGVFFLVKSSPNVHMNVTPEGKCIIGWNFCPFSVVKKCCKQVLFLLLHNRVSTIAPVPRPAGSLRGIISCIIPLLVNCSDMKWIRWRAD